MNEKIFIKINEPSKILAKINNSPNLFVRMNDREKIIINLAKQNNLFFKLNNTPKILVRLGYVTTGISTGTLQHDLLNNLDYENAGHIGFQKKLEYISEYKCYEID
jgi:hypothetical protein